MDIKHQVSSFGETMRALNTQLAEEKRKERTARDAQIMAVQENLASAFVRRLLRMINQFEQNLQNDQEVGVKLVSFGQTIVIHVNAIGYSDPSLVRFIGNLDDGSPVELIQHVSQISFLLMAVKALTPEAPQRNIGFIQS